MMSFLQKLPRNPNFWSLMWLQVQLGSFVEVLSGERDAEGNDKPFLMEVTELFEDVRVQH